MLHYRSINSVTQRYQYLNAGTPDDEIWQKREIYMDESEQNGKF